jgi:predicted membrane-bound mannosyltransferase
MLTVFGACALTFMMLTYAVERRHRRFILAFACGCGLSSVYGFLAGTWPFGVAEAIWAVIALRRYAQSSPSAAGRRTAEQRQAEPHPTPERVL